MTEPQYLFFSLPFTLFLPFYFTTWYQNIFDLGYCDLLKFLAAAFWWLLGLISLAVFLIDCFLAALFHHHGCVDVVLCFFGGSLLVHLCLVVGVCCLNSGIRISLFHLLEILILDLFWLLCILLIFGSVPSNSHASNYFWVDSQPNLFSLRCFSHLGCWWLLLLLPLVSVVGSSPSTLSVFGSLPSTLSSWLLVHRLQQSRLDSQSTRSSLDHLSTCCLYSSSWTYMIYKF